jgi:hypothetical protein
MSITIGIGIKPRSSGAAPTPPVLPSDIETITTSENIQVIALGDSFTRGESTANPETQGFIPVLNSMLQLLCGNGGTYVASPPMSGMTMNTAWGRLNASVVGRNIISPWTGSIFNGIGGYFDATTTLTLTVNGSSMDIVYGECTQATNGMMIAIDGGAPVYYGNFYPFAIGRIQWRKINIPLGADVDHTVVFTGPDYWELTHVIGKKGNGIRTFHAGMDGAIAGNFGVALDTEFLKLMKPRIVIVELGINDYLLQTALVNYETYIENIIVSAQEYADCVILVNQPQFNLSANAIPRSDYNDILTTLAGTYGCLLYDLDAKFVSLANGVAQGWQTGMGNGHPTILGHSVIATDLYNMILGFAFTLPPYAYEPELTTYITGLATPLSSGQLTKLNTLIKNIKEGMGILNLSDKFDCMYILAGETQESSLKNIVKNAHHCTSPAMPTFTAFEGFKGNGSTQYLDTNYNPSIDKVKYSLSHAALGVYSRTNNSEASAEIAVSDAAHANSSELSFNWAGTSSKGLNSNSILGGTITNPSIGFKSEVRLVGSYIHTFYNGLFLEYVVCAETGIANNNFYICGWNLNGILSYQSTKQLSLVTISEAIYTMDNKVLCDAFEAYMDSNGKGVI